MIDRDNYDYNVHDDFDGNGVDDVNVNELNEIYDTPYVYAES